MKKEDVYKRVDSILAKLEKKAGEYGKGHFPMEREILFNEKEGKMYIEVIITDQFGYKGWYNCGYINTETGRYSTKCKYSSYYHTKSLFRPEYDTLIQHFGLVPLDDEDRLKAEHEAVVYQQCREIIAAEKEGRQPRRVTYVDGEFVYEGVYKKNW